MMMFGGSHLQPGRVHLRTGGSCPSQACSASPSQHLRPDTFAGRLQAEYFVLCGPVIAVAMQARQRSAQHGLRSKRFRAKVACGASSAREYGAKAKLTRILLLGGTGRIGTAAAVHLLQRISEPLELVLAGRDEARGVSAMQEVQSEVNQIAAQPQGEDVSLSFRQLDWTKPDALQLLLRKETLPFDVMLHTAGPFDGDSGCGVLQAAIAAGIPIYVDVADPMDYIEMARSMSDSAKNAGTMALISAGAFPGFSNVLAVECAQRLRQSSGAAECKVKDIDFAYFTAGLGGSGPVNLLITNLGFGTAVPVFRDGAYSPQLIAGAEPRSVCFYIDESDPAFSLVGQRDVWSWPFPEAATVAGHLGITGNSNTGMGTDPGIWNTILVALVALVPRDLWQERWFSEGLAWFSLPLVWVTDQFVNETHAIRVRVTAPDGRECVAVQAHQSFRRCVAQSAAEFAMHLLERKSRAAEPGMPWQPGVWLPEELADDPAWRPGLLQRLSKTSGTVSCGFSIST